jgi:hypothetical protein
MSLSIRSLIYLYLVAAGTAAAAPLTCVSPGVARWPIKTTLPDAPKHKTMALADALALPRLAQVHKDDSRYSAARIDDQPVKEDSLVTISGWLYLMAFESDDCDFHIQISTQPHTTTAKPTPDDDCLIVEVPSGQYATTVSTEVETVRQWVVDNLLKKTDPVIGSVHVMVHPVYVTVTGALFYDDAHTYLKNGGTGRGKKGLQSKTLWELHPLTSIAFAVPPK